MRPPDKWQKRDPTEKRKRQRTYRSKSQRAAGKKSGAGAAAKSDAATPASDGSSPGDTATEAADGEDRDNNGEAAEDSNEPELPPMPQHPRASSAEPIVRSLRFGMALNKHPGVGVRATKSSPVNGSAKEPIELDLTPQPVRRQLFPSPDNIKTAQARAQAREAPTEKLPAFVRRSPRLNKTIDVLAPSPSHGPDSNKENIRVSRKDSLDDLFDHASYDADILLPPTTPTPKRRSERILFKTPSKTPQRAFGDMISPNIQRSIPGLGTPMMVSSKHSMVSAPVGTNKTPKNMTPFTRSIHEALAEASAQYVGTSPHRPSGNQSFDHVTNSILDPGMAFDFPDLPSLKGYSPVSSNPILHFDFSELTTEQLNTDYNDAFSTDATMPSSPPLGFFNFIDTNNDGMAAFWDAEGMGNGGVQQADHDMISAEPGPSQVLRRSPRKR